MMLKKEKYDMIFRKPETEDQINASSDQKLTIASIGPAGENQVRFAAIMNNKHRAAGRCGLGAVMGSKRLKAIACTGKHKIVLADKDDGQIKGGGKADAFVE